MRILINLILVIFDETIQILKKKSLLSILCMLLVAILGINFFSLLNTDTAKINLSSSIEKSIVYQETLNISGGGLLPTWFFPPNEDFDLVLHARLQRTFPDWPARIDYQKKQEKFYKSAKKKGIQLRRLRINDTSGFYTKKELDAICYFHSLGFYEKWQHPSQKPNIFDTRETYLRKMHNQAWREEYAERYKEFQMSK